MKKLFTTSLLVVGFFFQNITAQHNLIQNGSFEIKHHSKQNDSVPYDVAQIYEILTLISRDRFVLEWETRQREDNNIKIHSPDWFNSAVYYSFHNMQEFDHTASFPTSTQVPAYHGRHYIGMTNAELVQQKFLNHFKLSDNTTYTLEMYVRPVHLTGMGAFSGYYNTVYNWANGAILRAWVSNNKMRYQNNSAASFCNDIEDQDKQSGNRFRVLNRNFDLNDFDLNADITNDGVFAWKKVTTRFTHHSADDFDWFVIDLIGKNPNNVCDVYMLIDDVKINMTCEVGCEATCGLTDGPIWDDFQFTSQITAAAPLRFFGLHNVTSATLHITNFIGQQPVMNPVQFNCPNGFEGPLEWSDHGFLNSGLYRWRLEVENDCGKCSKSGVFEKLGDYFQTVTYSCNPEYLVKPCCQSDIYLDNVTLTGPDEIVFHAVNNLYIGDNVEIASDAIVKFYAGNEVIGDPYENAEFGADIDTDIIPCALRLAGNEDETEFDYDTVLVRLDTNDNRHLNSAINIHTIEETDSLVYVKGNWHTDQNESFDSQHGSLKKGKDTETEDELPSHPFTIIPNPNAGRFTVHLSGVNNQHLIISDMLGRTVFETSSASNSLEIDLSSQPKGMYFVKLITGGAEQEQTGGQIMVEKIVIR